MASDFRLKERLPQLTDRIVETYAEVGAISHLGSCPLPNYDTIITATQTLGTSVAGAFSKVSTAMTGA